MLCHTQYEDPTPPDTSVCPMLQFQVSVSLFSLKVAVAVAVANGWLQLHHTDITFQLTGSTA